MEGPHTSCNAYVYVYKAISYSIAVVSCNELGNGKFI